MMCLLYCPQMYDIVQSAAMHHDADMDKVLCVLWTLASGRKHELKTDVQAMVDPILNCEHI